MVFVDPTGQTTFDLIGPNSGVEVDERLEQEVTAGLQFDGTVNKGLFDWIDGRGRIFKRAMLAVGSESKDISLDIVDGKNRRWPIDARTSSTQTKIIITGRILLAPDEHIELVSTSAIAAMYANVVLQR